MLQVFRAILAFHNAVVGEGHAPRSLIWSQKQLKPKTLHMRDGAGILPYQSLNSGIHKV